MTEQQAGTRFTLVMAYYENPRMLFEQMCFLFRLPHPIRENLSVIIVDDGSPKNPAAENISSFAADSLASFQLWRMGVDVRWNQDACRNIGVREAPTSWVLLTDMDHIVPERTWERLMFEPIKSKQVYRFGRLTAPDLTPYKHHPNSWALTAKRYWQVGGYDEALAGNYGTDGDFLNRVRRHVGEPIELPEVLIRYPREVVPDASTTTLERKNIADKVRINSIVSARKANPGWKPLHFSFPCERVL